LEDGVILSIDDSELSNIKITLDEIFGGENYLATLVWDRNRKTTQNIFRRT
jgi:adenine-specific DNA-methyltransferase